MEDEGLVVVVFQDGCDCDIGIVKVMFVDVEGDVEWCVFGLYGRYWYLVDGVYRFLLYEFLQWLGKGWLLGFFLCGYVQEGLDEQLIDEFFVEVVMQVIYQVIVWIQFYLGYVVSVQVGILGQCCEVDVIWQ